MEVRKGAHLHPDGILGLQAEGASFSICLDLTAAVSIQGIELAYKNGERARPDDREQARFMIEEKQAPRLDIYKAWPEGYRAVGTLQAAVDNSGLEHSLMELVKTRCSQVNGCAHCLDMHTKDARAAGETEQRLYALSAWRETPFFTPRERAALALAESITLISETHVPDDVMEEAGEWFKPDELAKLVFVIVTINVWNRLAVTGRTPVGGYVSKKSVRG